MTAYYITATNFEAAKKFAAFLHSRGFAPSFELDAIERLAARDRRQRDICGLAYSPFICIVGSSPAGVSVDVFKLITGEKP